MKDHLVRNDLETCPYLPEQTARMPLYVPKVIRDAADTDRRLAEGQRRAGEFVYETDCPSCRACIPIRLDVNAYQPNRSQRRALSRGDRQLEMTIGELAADQQRVDLFNKHRQMRNLGKEGDQIDLEDYKWGFVRSCFESFELAFWDTPKNGKDNSRSESKLVMVAICDRGETSMSAVYTYYDPEIVGFSLGTYGIMKQVQYCKQNDLRFLYLGFFIERCRAMNYKSRFRPNQQLIDGRWVTMTD